uniref:F-box domain-containing protein n=1 Tax=Electrophorus electricus TaxID=8005 RepID=A0A4W4H440_ELEEL
MGEPWEIENKPYLLKCTQVCRAWMAIAQTCSLWSQVSVGRRAP